MSARPAAIPRPLALRLAEREYERFLAQLRVLPAQAWKERTDCPDWDVREMACHALGMVEMAASVRELVRQQRAAGKAAAASGAEPLDALTALQVAERADWSPERIMARFAERIPSAVAGRRRIPGFVRARRIPQPELVGGVPEWWTVGYLIDVILTRDPWLHRIDIARAAGLAPDLSADHDGLLVADIVAEWVQRHGRAVHLVLDGPAGGEWTYGHGGADIRCDAVEFARLLSARPSALPSSVILSTLVPF